MARFVISQGSVPGMNQQHPGLPRLPAVIQQPMLSSSSPNPSQMTMGATSSTMSMPEMDRTRKSEGPATKRPKL